MKLSRLVVSALLTAAVATGCKKEEPAPPPPPPPMEKPKPPPPPPAAAEPRADKECAAPLELAPAQELTLGTRKATLTGYQLSFADADPDALTFGVLGPINEDSGANMVVLKKYVKFFVEQKVDAILVPGDSGEVADGIARVLKVLAEAKVPVFVIAGNRECRAEYTNGVAAAQKDAPHIINMNQVRKVAFPEVTLVSLPGYHAPEYITCETGCRYHKANVDEVIKLAKESKGPTLLVAHGPPRGEGSQALDFAVSGGNVGDPDVARALTEGNIAFGVFSNIKEAGGRATDLQGSTVLKEGTSHKSLYLNPGAADTVGWEMNDGTKSTGLAAVLSIKGGEATWKTYRAKALTAAEKAEAKKQEPPPRAEPTPAPEEPANPAPPAGQPQDGGK